MFLRLSDGVLPPHWITFNANIVTAQQKSRTHANSTKCWQSDKYEVFQHRQCVSFKGKNIDWN